MSFLIDSSSDIKKYVLIGTIGLACIVGIAKLFHDNEDDEEKQMIVEGKKPAGIYNEGNTCFVNSLLQALASMGSFQLNLLKVIEVVRDQEDKNAHLIIELHIVITKINNNSESIDVLHLLDLISEVKKDLINLQQQDAHELYTAFVASFDTVINKNKQMDLSSSSFRLDEEELENNLIGYTKSSIVCNSCRNETAIKIHPFYDISLQIRQLHVVDIKTALRQFQRQQRIQNWTCSKCSIFRHCRKLVNSIKALNGANRLVLSRIGEEIIDFLNKMDSVQSQISEVNQSLSRFVKLRYENEYLQMTGDFERDLIFLELEGVQSIISKRTVITKYPKVLVIHLKQLIVNPFTGNPQLIRKHIDFEQNLVVTTKNRQKLYRLTSLLTHIGNQSMGHYFTFRRMNRDSDSWYVISDSDIRKCQWSYVKQSRAYMLFYETN